MARLSVRATAGGALVAFALLVGSSCSEDADVLDRKATEAEVAEAVAEPLGAEVDRVRCPAEIPRGEGHKVTCRVVVDGVEDQPRVEVEQTDDDGSISAELLDVVIERDRLETDMAAALTEQLGRDITVDCGDGGASVVEVGGWLECDAHDENAQRGVRAVVEDGSGTLSYVIHG